VHNAARTPGALFAAIDTPDSPCQNTTAGLTPCRTAARAATAWSASWSFAATPAGSYAPAATVDTFCLGVENTIGPDLIPREALPAFRDNYFAVFGAGYVEIPAALAIELVRGAVDYAAAVAGRPPRAGFPASGRGGALAAAEPRERDG